jgi:penicillin-binding protein-related factor A (putative recombinase)
MGGAAVNTQSQNRKQGKAGEELVKSALIARGVCMVEKIETGWGIIRATGGRIRSAFPLEKVAGDFRGVLQGGQSVLVEAKTAQNKLTYSEIKPHQREALQRHHELGGLSLVAWVHDDTVYLFQWPHVGFEAKTSLTPEKIQEWKPEM